MTTEYAIFAELNSEKILVFPSEITARSYLTGYAKRNEGRAVFADSVLSWDTFKRNFTLIPKEKEKAQSFHRMLFVSQFFQSPKIGQLKYFANCKFRESLPHFAKNTAENLKYFKRALASEKISRTVKEDIHRLYDAYNEFLNKNNLYEEEYLEPDFSEADKDKYILAYPQTITDPDIETALKAGFRTISVKDEDELNRITVYDNSVCEIKSTVRKIFELLKTCKASDIAVTLAQYDNYYPYLESECRIRDIKLSPSKGKTLDQYAGGKFFRDLQNLKFSEFDIEALKVFLFNPLYPFKNRELILKTVRTGIKNKIQNGISNWKYKLEKLNTQESLEILEFVNKLSVYVKLFSGCKNADELRKTFHNFQDEFFEKESWHTLENEVEKNAFERVLVLIDDIDRAMQLCSIKEIENFYEYFIRQLGSTVYTSNIRTEGIKVFSYPSTAALEVKHHFVLSLSDKDSAVKRITIPFEDEDRPENSITDNVIKAYALKTDNNVYISCSEESFDSVSSAPALFVEKMFADKKTETETASEDDSFRAEENLYKKDKDNRESLSTPNQKKWYDNSKEKLIKGLKCEEFQKQELPVKLNAYKINSFRKCPYNYLCSHIYNLSDEDDFSADMSDPKTVGTLLHDTYADFFNEVKNFDSFSTEENQKLLEKIFTEKLNGYAAEPEAPDKIQIIELSSKYKDIIKSISQVRDSGEFMPYQTDCMEKQLSFETDEYVINGRIDCIMKTANGDLAVIDFKKKNTDKDSLQLVIYASMLKDSSDYSKVPVLAALYSIEDEKFVIKWKDEHTFESVYFEFQKTMEEIISKIKNADYNPAPSSETCSNCDYSRLCRKRFVIK